MQLRAPGRVIHGMSHDLLHQRRSLRPGEYTDQPVDRDQLERLLQAANAAPSHKRTYPWRFVVFHSRESRATLGEYLAERERAASERPVPDIKLRKTRERPGKSAAAIAVVMLPDLDKLPEWEEVAATAAAVQNLWLAATAEGLAGYWSTPGALTAGAEAFLELRPNEKCLGIFYLGYPALEPAPVQRPTVEEKTTWR